MSEPRHRCLFAQRALSAWALLFTLVACARREAPSELALERDAEGAARAVVLRRAVPSRSAPIDLLKVYLVARERSDLALPPLVGVHSFRGEDLVFEPRFGFDARQRYRAVTESGMELVFPGVERDVDEELVPTTALQAIHPSAATWPENVLRVYLHFSAPMSIGRSSEFVRWRDAAGELVPHAFLEIAEELWDPSGKRLTLLFDPGRVKRGLVPHEELGRALRAGERYTLEIDARWPDASGRPLAQGSRHAITATAEDLASPAMDAWTLALPTAGTREPLRVAFGEALDAVLLREWLWIETGDGARVRGAIALEDAERVWTFTPDEPWRAAPHALVANDGLEDICGNSLRAPFEVDLFERVTPPAGVLRRRSFEPR
ncbi:MAG: hypothetical protein IPN34_25000 [Planctomycetes bacterium]|nr:hypothetical protein [Planctomycetota bacterium]